MATDLIDISDEAKAHIARLCEQATIDEKSFLGLCLSCGGSAQDQSGKTIERWPAELGVGTYLKDSVDLSDYAPIQIDSLTLYIHFQNLVRLRDKRIERQRVAVGYPNPNDRFLWLLIPTDKNPTSINYSPIYA